jgi:cobalamin biosynthesis Mg chelatase CobN
MAKTKLDLPTQLPESVSRPILAGVGVTDRVVEVVRDYVADMQKRTLALQKDVQKTVSELDYQPQALREQATKVLTARVESFNADAQARRKAVEERVAALQIDARTLPTRLQKLVDEQVATAGDTFDELVKRGESLVGRIRRQQSTQATTASAKTTVAKAKTTKTQATKAAKASTASAKKTAKKSPARSSAKATGTAATKTASSAAKAVTDAAEKIGD